MDSRLAISRLIFLRFLCLIGSFLFILFKFKSTQTYTSSLLVWIVRSILLSYSYRSLINYILHILVLYYLCQVNLPHSQEHRDRHENQMD